MRPFCRLAEAAFKREWYLTGWWFYRRIAKKDNGHFHIPRPEVYECPKCDEQHTCWRCKEEV
jgi:hypothetical protein